MMVKQRKKSSQRMNLLQYGISLRTQYYQKTRYHFIKTPLISEIFLSVGKTHFLNFIIRLKERIFINAEVVY